MSGKMQPTFAAYTYKFVLLNKARRERQIFDCPLHRNQEGRSTTGIGSWIQLAMTMIHCDLSHGVRHQK